MINLKGELYMGKKFKSLMFLIIGMIFMLVLAACSSDAGSNDDGGDDLSESDVGAAMEDFKVGDTFKATEPITLTTLFSDHPNYPLKDDWMLWEKIKEITNVELDITSVPMSDYTEKRSLLISSGDAPYIIPKTYPGEETPFVSS